MSDFSDRPFVAGSLTGLRAFDVDAYGRLVGPHRGGVFKPGENVATCQRSYWDDINAAMRLSLRSSLFGYGGYGLPSISESPRAESKQEHHVGRASCTCGYYAFYNGKNTSKTPANLAAIIEGYGVCSVGTQGFRAEKARLVALIAPRKWDRWLTDWRTAAAWAAWSLIWGAFQGYREHWWSFGVMALAFAISIVWAIVGFRGRRKRMATPPDIALVRRNYPDVPVHRSLRAALRTHPLTPPPAPAPDEPDFWTREAS